MFYVYVLQSLVNPEKNYIGYTTDVVRRLQVHNAGGSVYTSVDKPWKLVVSIAFDDKYKALYFEKYLKSGSGKAFATKRFL